MIIFSQDRKQIVDCVTVGISKNFGGKKEERFLILASSAGADLGTNIVAAYPDEKTAMDELEKIFAALENGAKTYKM